MDRQPFISVSLANTFRREIDEPEAENGESSRGVREPTPEEVITIWKGRPKNTQRASERRSPMYDGVVPRLIPCLRYAGEINNFPDLICWDPPQGSTTGKCGDCARKHNFCYDVSAGDR